MTREGLVQRAAIAVAVALAVALASVVAASVMAPPTFRTGDVDADEPPGEYDPGEVVAEPIPATGDVAVDESLHAGDHERRVVLVDPASRVTQEEIRPFVRAVVAAGHVVRFRDGPLPAALRTADAYVRVDPGSGLSGEGRAAVANFTDRGGHLLLIAEPNRVEVEVQQFSAQVTTVRTAMVDLAAQYGIVFGNRYLYDTRTNDGNFRNVLAHPTGADDAPPVDRVALGTATRVESRNGTVLLRTPPSTKLSKGGPVDEHPVAVRTGTVVAVGDKTFLTEGRHTVADNEAFVGYLVEFAIRGDAALENATVAETDTPTETPSATPEEDGPEPQNTTETPTPVTGGE